MSKASGLRGRSCGGAAAEVLEAQGDPLGEYIRLACEDARLRVGGDLGDRYVTQTLREWALVREAVLGGTITSSKRRCRVEKP